MKIRSSQGRKCFLFHRLETVLDTKFTVYKECKDCKTRVVTQPKNSVYQPIDLDWAMYKKPLYRLPKSVDIIDHGL
jgi:hypothetical protein